MQLSEERGAPMFTVNIEFNRTLNKAVVSKVRSMSLIEDRD